MTTPDTPLCEAERWVDVRERGRPYPEIAEAGDALHARVTLLEDRLRLIANVAWQGSAGALHRVQFLAEELVPFDGIEAS